MPRIHPRRLQTAATSQLTPESFKPKSSHEPQPPLDDRARRLDLTVAAHMRLPILGALDIIEGDPEQYLAVGIGDGRGISGRVLPRNNTTIVSIGRMDVSPALQGRGIGSRIARAFLAEAKVLGAQELWSDSNSNKALWMAAKIVGPGCLRFYDQNDPNKTILPITLEEATVLNDETRQTYVDEEDAIGNEIGAFVDLRTVNTSDWERVTHLEISR